METKQRLLTCSSAEEFSLQGPNPTTFHQLPGTHPEAGQGSYPAGSTSYTPVGSACCMQENLVFSPLCSIICTCCVHWGLQRGAVLSVCEGVQ